MRLRIEAKHGPKDLSAKLRKKIAKIMLRSESTGSIQISRAIRNTNYPRKTRVFTFSIAVTKSRKSMITILIC